MDRRGARRGDQSAAAGGRQPGDFHRGGLPRLRGRVRLPLGNPGLGQRLRVSRAPRAPLLPGALSLHRAAVPRRSLLGRHLQGGRFGLGTRAADRGRARHPQRDRPMAHRQAPGARPRDSALGGRARLPRRHGRHLRRAGLRRTRDLQRSGPGRGQGVLRRRPPTRGLGQQLSQCPHSRGDRGRAALGLVRRAGSGLALPAARRDIRHLSVRVEPGAHGLGRGAADGFGFGRARRRHTVPPAAALARRRAHLVGARSAAGHAARRHAAPGRRRPRRRVPDAARPALRPVDRGVGRRRPHLERAFRYRARDVRRRSRHRACLLVEGRPAARRHAAALRLQRGRRAQHARRRDPRRLALCRRPCAWIVQLLRAVHRRGAQLVAADSRGWPQPAPPAC